MWSNDIAGTSGSRTKRYLKETTIITNTTTQQQHLPV